MKFITLLSFLLILISSINGQDTVNVTLIDYLSRNKLDNMNITLYEKTGREDEVIPSTKESGADFIVRKKGGYLFKVSESGSGANNYINEYYEREITENHHFQIEMRPNIKDFVLGINITNSESWDSTFRAELEISTDNGPVFHMSAFDGMIDSILVPTRSLLKIEVVHDFYETSYESYYNNGTVLAYNIPIKLKRKVFDHEIILLNDENDELIDGAVVSFPEIKLHPNRKLIDTTDQIGSVHFKNLPSGYQKIAIQPISGYTNRANEEYFVFVDNKSEINIGKSQIRLRPKPKLKEIQFSGIVQDENSKLINGATVDLLVNDVSIDRTHSINGVFKNSVYENTFQSGCDFDLVISHHEFESKTINDKISMCELDKGVISLDPMNLIRKYDEYSISLRTKKKVFKPHRVIFTNSNNLGGRDEEGYNLSVSSEDNNFDVVVMGPVEFKEIIIEYYTRNKKKKKCYIENNQKPELNKHIWLIRGKRGIPNYTTSNKRDDAMSP